MKINPTCVAMVMALMADGCKKRPNISGTFTTAEGHVLSRSSGDRTGEIEVRLSDEQADTTAFRILVRGGLSRAIVCEGRASRGDRSGGGANFNISPMACRYGDPTTGEARDPGCPAPQLNAVAFQFDPSASSEALKVFAGQISITPGSGDPPGYCTEFLRVTAPTDTVLRRSTSSRESS